MRIVADKNIPLLADFFSQVCDLIQIDGREIDAASVRAADALVVRSITPVTAHLLENSSVRFVATATSGTDHVDSAWLAANDIKLVSAPGANASAVADYVMTAFCHCGLPDRLATAGLKCGIVGVGHVGSEVARRFAALGCELLLCDPPRQQQGEPAAREFVSLDVIQQCDVVSVHVPLVSEGLHQTRQLITGDLLEALPANALFVNTSRGEVLNERDAIYVVQNRTDLQLVLDVFDNEPRVDQELVALATLATPHIAGYSRLAKNTAALRVAQALAEHFQLQAEMNLVAAARQSTAVVSSAEWERDKNASLQRLLQSCFDIAAVSTRFKAATAKCEPEHIFDSMRRELAERKEYSQLQLDVQAGSEAAGLLAGLGFSLPERG